MPRVKVKSVIGLDTSSTGIAWTVVRNGKPYKWGKIKLTATGVPNKLKQADEGLRAVIKLYKPDYIYIEKSIYVRSVATMRLLSYVVGAMMLTATSCKTKILDVEPMTWKSWLGYTALSRKFRAEATKKLGKKDATKLCETLRKSQTYRVINHNFPTFEINDHDIADSCGIALYCWQKQVGDLKLQISKEVAIDQSELASMGLCL